MTTLLSKIQTKLLSPNKVHRYLGNDKHSKESTKSKRELQQNARDWQTTAATLVVVAVALSLLIVIFVPYMVNPNSASHVLNLRNYATMEKDRTVPALYNSLPYNYKLQPVLYSSSQFSQSRISALPDTFISPVSISSTFCDPTVNYNEQPAECQTATDQHRETVAIVVGISIIIFLLAIIGALLI